MKEPFEIKGIGRGLISVVSILQLLPMGVQQLLQLLLGFGIQLLLRLGVQLLQLLLGLGLQEGKMGSFNL